MAIGALLSLVFVAGPLWLLGLGEAEPESRSAPLAALATLVAEPAEFNIIKILDGNWVGEMCKHDGEPMPVRFEFVVDSDDTVSYSILAGAGFEGEGIVGTSSCKVEGEQISFHAFLAILTDCQEVCGIDRAYQGHFDDGALVGTYADGVVDEDCRSCLGGGTWWLVPEG